MRASETRIVNQCTYTPIGRPPASTHVVLVEQPSDGASDQPPDLETAKARLARYRPVSQKPFFKQNIVVSVFDHPELSQVVLDCLRKLPPKDILPDTPEVYSDLAKAVDSVWAGDVRSSIGILRNMTNEQVVRFATKALDVERLLLERARGDWNEATSALARESQVETTKVAEQEKTLSELRESILTTVRKEVRETFASLARPAAAQPAQPESGTVQPSLPQMPALPVVEPAALTAAQPAPPAITAKEPVITAPMIRTRLERDFPESARVLSAVGVLPAGPLSAAERGLASQLLDIIRDRVDKKYRQVEAEADNLHIEPVGYLHLERLQFTPLGYERGELVYSLPLTPQETIRLSYREWSRTETEYVKLVATELETATEEALSEKSELTQSTNVQQQHSSAMNTSTTVSGGYGGVNISSSFGYSVNDSQSQSRQDTAKRAQEITKKASSRVKQEQKVSFKVVTAYEREEQSYREIKNPLDRAVRYDFHRLMKKWRIDLYRYDVRLTYDIVIPEPGSYLLRKYVLLQKIEDELAKPNPFNLAPTDITRESYESLSQTYGVGLDQPPVDSYPDTAGKDVIYSKSKMLGYDTLELILPSGYEFESCEPLGANTASATWIVPIRQWWVGTHGSVNACTSENGARLEAGAKHSNRFDWVYCMFWGIGFDDRTGTPVPLPSDEQAALQEGNIVTIKVYFVGRPVQALKDWQMKCYERLADAAKMQYEAKQQRLQAIRDALLDELNREDALTLRKLEREELMKNVLRWLLGPTFRLYPQDKWHLPDVTLDLETLDLSAGANLEDTALAYYEDEDAENKQNKQNVKSEFYRPTIQFGEMVRFLHQAIEWENMIYVLYPYFWSYPDKPRWDFKQSLYHSDFAHRNFLRAGAARVVLPVRPGFERDFLNFVEGCVEGKPPQESPSQESPYMSIADEVEAMAKTNYPYTQDANAEKEEYMFTWENVPGRDSGRLQRYLRQEFYIAWAEDDATKITKSGDGKTIQVAINQESQGQSGGRVTGAISIALDKDKGVAVMQVTDSKSYDLSARQEEGKWKIYRQQNLVDTWYEFTPTGALDVVEGTVISG